MDVFVVIYSVDFMSTVVNIRFWIKCLSNFLH